MSEKTNKRKKCGKEPNRVYRWVTVSTRTTHAYLVSADFGATDDEIYDAFTFDIPSEGDAATVDEDGCDVEVDGRVPSPAEIQRHKESIVALGHVGPAPGGGHA